MFSVKDLVPLMLRSRVVYKVSRAGCNACYIGETSRHLSAPIREQVGAGTRTFSNIYNNL